MNRYVSPFVCCGTKTEVGTTVHGPNYTKRHRYCIECNKSYVTFEVFRETFDPTEPASVPITTSQPQDVQSSNLETMIRSLERGELVTPRSNPVSHNVVIADDFSNLPDKRPVPKIAYRVPCPHCNAPDSKIKYTERHPDAYYRYHQCGLVLCGKYFATATTWDGKKTSVLLRMPSKRKNY